MMSPTPEEARWNLPIPYTVFLELGKHMTDVGFKASLGDFAGIALREWLAQQRLARTSDTGSRPRTSGYQWKRLFLPDGTVVRTIFKGRSFIAQVEECHLVYEGRAMSPNDFANSPGGARRNAWNTLWLLFPDAHDWVLAADCRHSPQRVVT